MRLTVIFKKTKKARQMLKSKTAGELYPILKERQPNESPASNSRYGENKISDAAREDFRSFSCSAPHFRK